MIHTNECEHCGYTDQNYMYMLKHETRCRILRSRYRKLLKLIKGYPINSKEFVRAARLISIVGSEIDNKIQNQQSVKNYIAHFKLEKVCDYAVGCGLVTMNFQSENLHSATQLAVNRIQDVHTKEIRLKECQVFEVVDSATINVERVYEQLNLAEKIFKLNEKRENKTHNTKD